MPRPPLRRRSRGCPSGRFPAGADARPNPDGRFIVGQIIRAVIADILPPVRRRKTARGASTSAGGRQGCSRGDACLLIEGLLGYAKGVHRRRHPAVEHHLRDDFRDFFLGDADMQRAGDVALDHLRAMAQHYQRGDGA